MNCELSGGFNFVGELPRTRKNTIEFDRNLTRQGAGKSGGTLNPANLKAKHA